MDRDNYYLILGLDPGENDAGRIAKAIQDRRSEWTGKLNHPTLGKRYRSYLDSVPKIEALMKDETLRKQEAADARKKLDEDRAKALKQVDEEIGIASGKGYLTEAEVTAMVNRHKAALKEAEIRTRLTQRKIEVRAREKEEKKARPRLDSATEKAIKEGLEVAKKKDLYDFLDLPRSAALALLQARAKDVYDTVRKVAVKDAVVTAQQELTGHCMKVFATETERTRYDGSLAWIRLDRLLELATAAGTGAGRIHSGAVQTLIQTGKQDGLTPDEVIEAIRKLAVDRKWLIEVPAEAAAQTLQSCGNCGELADVKASACPRCRLPLRVNCPRCRTESPSSARVCAKAGCNFDIGSMPIAERCVRDARTELSLGEEAAAARLLKDALTYWPGHAEATRLQGELQHASDARNAAENAVQKAVTGKLFVAADAALIELARLAPRHARLSDLQQQVKTALRTAEDQVTRARQLERQNKPDDAIDAYCAALAACADCKAAQDGLARCPPEPASSATAVPGMAIVVSWQASKSRGQVRYRVVRKVGSEPLSSADGQALGETAGTTLTDPGAIPGEVYYYSVYADRGGVAAIKGAIIGPVLRTAEVSELRAAVVANGSIALSWKPPPKARGFEVWREANGEPRRRGEGTRVATVTPTSAADNGLRNNTTYGYRVCVVYAGPKGETLVTPGVTISVLSAELPRPVTDLQVTRRAGQVEAVWTPPPNGQVRVYALTGPNRHRSGEVIALEEVDGLGRRVPTTGPNMAREPLPADTELTLLPVTVLGSTGVVGAAVTVSWIDDVTDLTANARGGVLYAQWRYPKGIDLVIVAFRTDQSPTGPDDPQATVARCSRAQYEVNGGFRYQPLPQAERIFLAVYSATSRGERFQYSGAADARREVAVQRHRTVRYRVTPPGFLSRKCTLTLTPDADTTLPALWLVAKAGGMPLSPRDGVTVHGIVEGCTCTPARPFVVTFDLPGGMKPQNLRVFPVDDSDCHWLDLIRTS